MKQPCVPSMSCRGRSPEPSTPCGNAGTARNDCVGPDAFTHVAPTGSTPARRCTAQARAGECLFGVEMRKRRTGGIKNPEINPAEDAPLSHLSHAPICGARTKEG